MSMGIYRTKAGFLSPRLITVIVSSIVMCFGVSVSVSYSTTYYVATNGSDGNSGTLVAPFRTIQRYLNIVHPGDTCLVRGGTYNEALVLKTSGSSSARITLKNYNGETVTIHSGNSRALETGGRIHYYIIGGLRFISNHVDYGGRDYTLDFEMGIWDGVDNPNGGNNGFIIRDCYIEGSIHFYGHYNTVENCEINGRSQWKIGLSDWFAASHHNTYKNNTIYGYTSRGVWTMNGTSNILVEGNTIHNCVTGIDIDGAGIPSTDCIVKDNHIYNCNHRSIEFENGFNGICDYNLVHDCLWGIHYINYGEYRDDYNNGLIRNNVVYNTVEGGIRLTNSRANRIYNNTVYNDTSYGGIVIKGDDPSYISNNDIRNNIVFVLGNRRYAFRMYSPNREPTGVILTNNLYYNFNDSHTHYMERTSTEYTLSGFKGAFGGWETNSLFSDPLFVNVGAGNFHLQNESPAIDAGYNLSPEVVDDIEGHHRPQGAAYDIGAFEFITGNGDDSDPPSPPQGLEIF